jgi:methylmalonyl-CoA/ethylmalonyl-CoA epimerase
MGTIIRINHVAIVVEDIENALGFWRDSLGLSLSHVEDVPDQDALVAFLPVGDAEVELVRPTSEGSGIARYLKKRGPGVHHICFEVDDIDSCLKILESRNVRLINEEAIIGTGGKRIAFIHPESTYGVLVELYELSPEEPAIRLARVRSMAERVIDQGQVVAAGLVGFLRTFREGQSKE